MINIVEIPFEICNNGDDNSLHVSVCICKEAGSPRATCWDCEAGTPSTPVGAWSRVQGEGDPLPLRGPGTVTPGKYFF